ncbi:hypothetical protein [Nostoc sp.]|uniref:hypothetical protein n=1 Tax=Nostoc sp. TaxID=1180 RepID=UPI002FF8115B
MNEELASNSKLHINHWADAARKAFVSDVSERRVMSNVYNGLHLRAFSDLEQPIAHSLQQYKRVLLNELAVSINSSLACFEVSDAA